MEDLPSVSIIIPCRNEKEFIPLCLNSLLNNNYPRDKMEILVIDGMSQDGTREVAKEYVEKYSFIHLLDNPKLITPSALNIGVRRSRNNIIIRIDAHAVYKTDYISKSVTYLEKYNADNIGGIWIIVPRKDTIIGRGIAKSLSSFFGTGNAYYKIGSENFRAVDTVPFGCYRKEIFTKIGFFNENLERSQDMEFNTRLKRNGGKIYLFPEIVGYYYARSGLKEFFIHNFKDGIWAVYPLKFVRMAFKFRHYIPLMFVSSLILLFALSSLSEYIFYLFCGLIFFYLCSLIYFSIKISSVEKDPTLLLSLPVAFAVRHFGYGLGSIWGIIKIILD